MSATSRGGERSEADFYRTCAWVVHRFLERCQLPGGEWLELGAGEGDIIRAVQSFCDQVKGYDVGARWTAVELRAQCRPILEDVAERVVIANAISATKRDLGARAKFAVSCGNPPFRHAIEFIHQSLRLARWTALLLRLDFLAGAERQAFMRAHPPDVYGPSLSPYRTAAECITWDIPCPSIFERKKPLADKTLARIARGLRRYVIDAAEPFIVPVTHAGDLRSRPASAPMPTITGAHRGEHALVTPTLTKFQQNSSGQDLRAPMDTVMAGATRFGLVSPTLIQQSWGERQGQAPRILDLHKPLGTIVAQGTKQALVAALLAKHNGGHEGPGQSLERPVDTLVCKNNKALVTSHMLKLRGGLADHHNTSQDWRVPAPTITAGGTHIAEVRAFLIKYYGEERQNPRLDEPLHTITTKHRFGLVTVQGVEYQIVDVGMRMLWPRELFRAQSFPDSYEIDIGADGEALTKTDQVAMCGNSVPPIEVCALVKANYAERLAVRRFA